MKPLKEEVNIPNIEKPPNEPKIGLFEIKNEKDFEQNSKTATLDPKISSVKSEVETFKKVEKNHSNKEQNDTHGQQQTLSSTQNI